MTLCECECFECLKLYILNSDPKQYRLNLYTNMENIILYYLNPFQTPQTPMVFLNKKKKNNLNLSSLFQLHTLKRRLQKSTPHPSRQNIPMGQDRVKRVEFCKFLSMFLQQ